MSLDFDFKRKKVIDILIFLWENNIWDLAKPLAIFVYNSKNIDNIILDIIIDIISKTIKITKDKIKIEKLINAKSEFENLLEQEKLDTENDLKDIDNIYKSFF